MRTGRSNEVTPEQSAFILCFLAIIWRRVLITVCIYCKHNDIDISSNIVLKCLKYNVLADTGIGKILKPFLVKALTVGFLMPQDYENNPYAQRAVKLFGPAYEIIKQNNNREMEFIHEYAASAFNEATKLFQEETEDVVKDVSADITDQMENLTINKHTCKLCRLVDIWDVNLGLVQSEDPYQNVIMIGLLRAFDTYSEI